MQRHFGTATVLGLVIAGLGVVSPIVWDKYKTKSGLELRHVAAITLADKTDGLEKLQISYDSRPIRCVTKLAFVLFNYGRRPILQAELITPPQIIFTPPDTLLDAQIDSTSPENLGATSTVDRTTGTVSVSFPLMNPGDTVRFSVLVGSTTPTFHSAARIAGISDIAFVDLLTIQAAQDRRVPWTVYPVSFFSLMAWVLLAFGAVPDLFREARVRRRLREGHLATPLISEPSSYLSFVRSTFSYKTPQERKALLQLATDLSKQTAVSQQQHREFMAKVDELCKTRSATVPAFWFLTILGIIGAWYVMATVL